MKNKHPWMHETNGKQEVEHEHEDVVEDVTEEVLEEEVVEETAEAVEEVNEEFKDLAVGSRDTQDGQVVYWNGHSWVSRAEYNKQ